MGDTTIEWTRGDDGSRGKTWNPVTGCEKVSPGCDHCYAETLSERFRGTPGHYFENGFDVQLRPDKLDLPLRWRKPRKVFVNSMSDLFHDSVPADYIIDVFAVMAKAKQHTFQVLTKRHARMRSLLSDGGFAREMWYRLGIVEYPEVLDEVWPLPNVWLGVSAEGQKWADIRIPALLDTPAAVRFISAEPLLGPITLSGDALGHYYGGDPREDITGLDWVIVGGESGPKARPMHPDWARSLRDQCVDAGMPFHFKQWGEWAALVHPDDAGAELYVQREDGRTATDDDLFHISTGHWWGVRRVGKKRAGRLLDGRTWDEFPGGDA